MTPSIRPRVPRGFAAEMSIVLADLRKEMTLLGEGQVRLEEGQKATNEHLRVLNGRTATGEARTTLLELKNATDAGAKAQNNKWMSALKPVFLMLGTAIGTLILANGPKVLQAIQGLAK